MSKIEKARSGLLLADRMSRPQILRDAADILEQPGAWTQDYYAKTATGLYVDPWNEQAVCFCARGAVVKASAQESYCASDSVTTDLMLSVGSITGWNDDPDRTQAEVVAALRESADRVEAKA